MELSIIIVTYNSEKDIKNCINSVMNKTVGLKFEIIVVDNDSADNTVLILEKIVLFNKKVHILKSENKGFNYANNIGLKFSKGKYICLLNPDTILINNAFKIIIDGMNINKKIGMAGAKLYDRDGNSNLTFGSFPSIYETIIRGLNIRKNSYYLGDKKNKPFYVPYPCGADFMFRKDIINSIGYMDEKYFLYYDETDFGFRISKIGYKACIYPDAKIIHLQGKSTESVSEFAKKKFLESYVYYNIKNLNKIQTMGICYIHINTEKFKILLKIGNKQYHLNELKFYFKVLMLLKKVEFQR